jgi:DNA-directed RNA polymerase subunit RPC12/RpoP
MARDRQTIGPCPRCSQGTLTCSYNLFVKDALTIHSWEHRCADCGHRVTQAFRSDQSDPDATTDPTVCPLCGRNAVT